jgi:methionine-rich copper-binding protein CopC
VRLAVNTPPLTVAAGLGIVCLLVSLGGPVAAAPQQLRLVRSLPEEGARLTEPPGRLQLWFSGTPEPSVALVALSGPGGAIELGEPQPAEDDSLVVAVLGDMVPGDYRIIWRASIGGGRPSRGTVRFTILGG